MARTKNSLDSTTKQMHHDVRSKIRSIVKERKIIYLDALYPVKSGFSDHYISTQKRKIALDEIRKTSDYEKIDGRYIVKSPLAFDYAYAFKPKGKTYYEIHSEIMEIGEIFKPWMNRKGLKDSKYDEKTGEIPLRQNTSRLYSHAEKDFEKELDYFKQAIDHLEKISFTKPAFVRTDVVSHLVVQYSGMTMRKVVNLLPFNMFILGYAKYPNPNAKDKRFDIAGKPVVIYKHINSPLDYIPKHLKKLGIEYVKINTHVSDAS